MIRILSGFTGPGGSTVAFSNLVNLFNNNGMKACLYGPHEWTGIKCAYKREEPLINTDDTVIYHFRKPPDSRCAKLILSTHETEIFPVKAVEGLKYDAVHFVSDFQKKWQGVDGTVIPNVVTKYDPSIKLKKVAGVIGSIDQNKRVHTSIQRALDEGHDDVRVYGNITDGGYFATKVLPLLGEKVSYRGVSSDMKAVYATVTDVYHSPKMETFNLIKAECKYANVDYHGDEGNDTQAEYWDDDKILEAWKGLLT